MCHENCIFAAKEDCPKDAIELTCEECFRNKYHEDILKAINDFTSLGAAFVEVFEVLQTLIDNDGKTVKIRIPHESSKIVNRVMNALLAVRLELDCHEQIYKKLIFYFFGNLVDEFESKEYEKTDYLH